MFEIASTWDGLPLPKNQTIQFAVHNSPTALHLHWHAPFYGDPPPPGPPGPTNKCWEFEVIEFFILEDSQDLDKIHYTELEFSPHGHYLVLQLEGIRQPVRSLLPLEFHAQRQAHSWKGHAQIPHTLLPPSPHRWNAYAIHGQNEHRSYKAMTPVPGPHPDFHRLHLFPPMPSPPDLPNHFNF